MTHNPINQVIRQKTTVEKNANNKRKFENQPKDNRVPQQPPFKKSDVSRAYTIGANEKKAYARNLPYCNKCKLHHVGPCTVKCINCKRVCHMTRDCKASVAVMNQRAHVANPKTTISCYECGRLGHFRNECQKLRNQNQVTISVTLSLVSSTVTTSLSIVTWAKVDPGCLAVPAAELSPILKGGGENRALFQGGRNGYLRKRRKTKQKRQNRTRNGKAWKRHSQVQAQAPPAVVEPFNLEDPFENPPPPPPPPMDDQRTMAQLLEAPTEG
ncbi:reverse transcriptase domain-containing protein [Tanacetum coccineum]